MVVQEGLSQELTSEKKPDSYVLKKGNKELFVDSQDSFF